MTGDIERVILSSGSLTVEMMPARGSKMVSLRTEPDGYEFLAPAPAGSHVPDAAVFAAADAYGFDEMFPGVYPQPYPAAPWQDLSIADHGDLWYRPWQYDGGGTEAALWVEDVRMGWRFDKRLRFIQPRVLEIAYGVQNHSPHPLYWLYCAHILCHYRPGIELHLPAARYRQDETIGQPLPQWCTEQADFLRRFEAFPDDSAAFYVSEAVGHAACTWIDRPAGKALQLTWSPPVSYLAMWYNRNAWLPDQPLSHVGIEPTTAGSQDLAKWIQTAAPAPLAPGQQVTWALTLRVFDAEQSVAGEPGSVSNG